MLASFLIEGLAIFGGYLSQNVTKSLLSHSDILQNHGYPFRKFCGIVGVLFGNFAELWVLVWTKDIQIFYTLTRTAEDREK